MDPYTPLGRRSAGVDHGPRAAIARVWGFKHCPPLVHSPTRRRVLAPGTSELVKELLKLAGNESPLAGLGTDEVGGLDGGLCALEDRREEVTTEAEAPMPLELGHWPMHSHSALFCEVRVNNVTGEIRISRFLGSFDCGRVLNAKTAASQFRGGIVMGLGLALMEEVIFDERSGRIVNPSLADYPVPVHLDVPRHRRHLDRRAGHPHAPVGARGVCEIGITGVGAAVANAVFNATAKRVRDLPITLDKVM